MTAANARRRQRFASRGHELRERGLVGEVQRISFRVAGVSSAEAIELAKDEARIEGWTIKTVASARAATDAGLWIVTLAGVRG